MEHKNYGLLIDPIIIGKDFVLGSYGSLDGEIYQPDGQWDDFLPQDEFQNLNGVEPYACVSYSTLNCIEILIRRQFGEDHNYSDRFLAAVSGTAEQKGNSLQRVTEALRHAGVPAQSTWPFDTLVTTFEKFYAPIPDAVRVLALEFLSTFDYKHEYVPCDPSSLKTALRYSPLNIATYAWLQDGTTGLYYKPAGYPDNHSPVLYGYVEGQYWKIFDSYDNTHKRVKWDTQFGQAKRHKLSRLAQPTERQSVIATVIATLTKFNLVSYINAFLDSFNKPPSPPIPANNLLNTFCLEIQHHEGWYYGSRSYRNKNPGNCRYSRIGYASIYGTVKEDRLGVRDDQQGFAIFSTYELGYLYLKNLVKAKIAKHPTWDFYQFFGDEKEGWAPASDNNDSKHYAEVVADACDLAPTTHISVLL